jgi:heme/copper-type cytochrome/quinol oxidase subunit 2
MSTIAVERNGQDGHHRLVGLAVLAAGILLFAGSLFGLTAGIGAVWNAVTGSGQVAAGSGSAGSAAGVVTIHLVVKDIPNSAGQPHQAFVPASFVMHSGETVRVSVTNYTSMPHTWTSQALGVNAMIPAGGSSSPSSTTFTIHPGKAGTYDWQCEIPCDPWSMSHMGFMEGSVTVVKA